jgi:nitrite reductase/ring-hydroxylating ferredoxin subunit
VRFVVGPVSEFPPGERRIVKAGLREIGVFRIGDRFYGIRNRCPHQGGPLCTGHLLDDAVAAEPGRAELVKNPVRVACPWHGWEYDLETGQSFMGASEPGVRSYGVSTAPGSSLLAELSEEPTELRPGPYTAETFQVQVEDEFVVLHV